MSNRRHDHLIGDLIEVEVTTSSGGKGGGGGRSVVGYEYYVDVACCFARTGAAASAQIEKILADGKVVYERDPNVNVSGSITATATIIPTPVSVTGSATFSVWDLSSTDPAVNLGSLVPGKEVDVTGFTNAANNGTFLVVSSSFQASTGNSFARLQNVFGVSEGPVSVTIAQTLTPFQPDEIESVEEYSGSVSQTPSATIEAREGAGQVPAWRGYAYFVLKRFALKNFGNRVPLFNIIYSGGVTTSVSAWYSLIGQNGGLSPSFFNTTDLAGLTARGFVIRGVIDMAKAMQPLNVAFDVIEQEQGEGIRLFQRRNATIIDIDPADLYVNEVGRGRGSGYPIQVQDLPDVQFPEAVSVKYLDYQNSIQNGSQRERAQVKGSDNNELVVNLPINFLNGGTDARIIAKRILYEAFINRQEVSFSLPASYSHIQENDVVRFDALDNTWNLLVRKVDRGSNWILKFEAQVEVRSASIQTATHEAPIQSTGFYEPPPVFMDPVTFGTSSGPSPAPSPGPGPGTPGGGGGGVTKSPHGMTPATLWDREEFFTPVTIWWADEDTTSEFVEFGIVLAEAIQGFTRTQLAAAPNAHRVDTVNTVEVEVVGGRGLSSVSSTSDAMTFNVIRIGPEILAFKTATLISEGRYTLSNLIRGLAETDDQMGSHSQYETVCLLSDPGAAAATFPIPQAWVGTTKYIRATIAGESLADAPTHTWDIGAAGTMNRKIRNARFHRVDPTGEIQLVWNRVTSIPCRVFGEGAAPLDAAQELYEIDFMYPPSSGVVIATVAVEAPSRFFPAAEVSIFPFDLYIYQINAAGGGNGRGEASDMIVVPGV